MSALAKNGSGRPRIGSLWLYATAYLVFLYLPILFLPLFSFNDGTIIAFPLKGFTLKWYEQLAGADTLIGALENSLFVGASAALFSTLLGVFAARALVSYRFLGKRPAEAVIMAPLVIPGIIVATSLLILLSTVGIRPSLFAVILGHTFLALPFAVAIMKSSFDQFDVSLEEAAVDLGETAFGTWRRVTLPIVAPGIVSSFLVTFTVSFDEFILAFFLTGNQPTLPVYIWSQVRFPAKLPNVIALATLLILASVVLLYVAEKLRRRSERMGQPSKGDAA